MKLREQIGEGDKRAIEKQDEQGVRGRTGNEGK